jgi:hypothetical protein
MLQAGFENLKIRKKLCWSSSRQASLTISLDQQTIPSSIPRLKGMLQAKVKMDSSFGSKFQTTKKALMNLIRDHLHTLKRSLFMILL